MASFRGPEKIEIMVKFWESQLQNLLSSLESWRKQNRWRATEHRLIGMSSFKLEESGGGGACL